MTGHNVCSKMACISVRRVKRSTLIVVVVGYSSS